MTAQVPQSIWKNPIHFVAFGFGSGASPVAPGTAGTVVGVLFYLVLQSINLPYYLLIVTILFVVGCYICDVTEKDVGVTDHSGIVWDEIVGYLITMINAPRGWLWVLSGFLLFRIIDIYKPWPISLVEKYLHGGLAIMLDDVLAALGAFVVLQLAARLFY